ncbi:lytic murein transglycosylase [Rhodococcus aerolatus]
MRVCPALLIACVVLGGCGGPVPLTQVGFTTTLSVPDRESVPDAAGAAPDLLAGWAAAHATAEVPARAVLAYGEAELLLRHLSPGCGLSWNTLAGLGTVESANGTLGGAVLSADGRTTPVVRGPVLDGTNGNADIADTDQGRLDGDTTYDRAVGPLQFIPQTWERWATDGDADGVADPDDLDDAAATAGRYLCAAGGDLTTAQGWTAAVFAYNHSDRYVRDVHDAAEAAVTP